MADPRVDRPTMPPGYGIEDATEYMSWPLVESKLTDAAHYWLSTVSRDGSPHVVPRWGVWIDGGFWYDGSTDTRHVRNLEENQQCVLHLEDGAAATIVHGRSQTAQTVSAVWGERLSVEFRRKYAPEYSPGPDAWSGESAGGLRSLHPRLVIAWTKFPIDMTRFKFD